MRFVISVENRNMCSEILVMEVVVGCNAKYGWDWEGNENETCLCLGAGMEMRLNH